MMWLGGSALVIIGSGDCMVLVKTDMAMRRPLPQMQAQQREAQDPIKMQTLPPSLLCIHPSPATPTAAHAKNQPTALMQKMKATVQPRSRHCRPAAALLPAYPHPQWPLLLLALTQVLLLNAGAKGRVQLVALPSSDAPSVPAKRTAPTHRAARGSRQAA